MELRKCFTVSLLLILTLIVISDLVSGQKQLPCNRNTVNEIDRILAKVSPLGNPDVEFPESFPEVQRYCKQAQRPLAVLEDLNRRCMKGIFKEVVSVVVYSVKKKRKSLCRKTPNAEVRDLIDSGKCVKRGRAQMEKCANKHIDRFLGIKHVDQDLKIPLVCCEISKAKNCVLNVLNKINICTEKHKQTLLGHFESLSGSALKLACNEYNENGDRCNKLKNINLQPKKGQRRPKSLMVPVIDLFQSLDQD